MLDPGLRNSSRSASCAGRSPTRRVEARGVGRAGARAIEGQPVAAVVVASRCRARSARPTPARVDALRRVGARQRGLERACSTRWPSMPASPRRPCTRTSSKEILFLAMLDARFGERLDGARTHPVEREDPDTQASRRAAASSPRSSHSPTGSDSLRVHRLRGPQHEGFRVELVRDTGMMRHRIAELLAAARPAWG